MWRKVLGICLAMSMMLLLSACGSEETATYKGEIDTNPDKGLEVMGEHVTYDPNHLRTTASRWSWSGGFGTPRIYLALSRKSMKRSTRM